jgi:hypothetical protein
MPGFTAVAAPPSVAYTCVQYLPTPQAPTWCGMDDALGCLVKGLAVGEEDFGHFSVLRIAWLW